MSLELTRTKAIRIASTGAPEVMALEDVDLPPPGPGEVQIRHEAVGLNYIDVYFRSGLYPQTLPAGIGLEGAGIVTAVGEGAAFAVGDRVAYCDRPPGSYAQARNMPAKAVVKVPEAIGLDTAAAMMLKGMTVEYLLHRTFAVKPGQTILFHAAAGGVGLIAMQWAKALGATVIGTVGSDEKAELARKHGCDYPIVYTRENFQQKVMEITGGKGVPVVYDSIGKDTFQSSIDCLEAFGMFVSFGNASGPVPPVPLTALKGSLFLCRPSLMAYTAQRSTLEAMSAKLFEAVSSGKVHIAIDQRYPLSEAVQAHHDLEARKTTGSTILIP